MVAASGGATRPVHAERLRLAELRLQGPRGFERPALGLDEREMAVIDARAAHEAAHDLGRIVAQLLQERLIRQLADFRVGDVGQNEVLPDGDAYLAAAVNLRHAREFGELSGVDAADRHGEAGIIQSALLLAENADMV